MRRRAVFWVAVALLASGFLLIGDGLWMRAKARLAAGLIARAFEAHLRDGRPHRPWSWADLHPLARLEVKRLGVERYVLSGASGSSMAFGIGHIDGTAGPNEPGHSVLAGHRDSWLAFLEDVQVGDRLALTTRAATTEYEVRRILIVVERDTWVLDPSPETRLTLLTCYPFDGLLRGPRRYVVIAEPVEG